MTRDDTIEDGWAGNWLEDGPGNHYYGNYLGAKIWYDVVQGYTYSWNWNYSSSIGDALLKGQGSVMTVYAQTESDIGSPQDTLQVGVNFAFTGQCHDWQLGMGLEWAGGDNSNC